ncbi:MAG: autotransporter-associated beta strand repeat-containing protein [Kiritimatiellae bacterium]|nr:autotransporter-associated beta strand repeat-containing protein [Kiritimatiellia bacterium]
MQCSRVRLGILIALLGFTAGSFAADVTWTGGATGGDRVWSNTGNWLPGSVPVDNDSLIFGQGTGHATTNNLSARIFQWLWFSNSTWTLSGNGIRLTAGMSNTVSGTQTIGLSITTTAAQVWHNAPANAVVQLNSNAALAINAAVQLTGAGQFQWFGTITGTAPLRVSLSNVAGAAIAELFVTNNANTYSGPVTIDFSNRVRVASFSQISSGSITVTNGGQLYLVGATNVGPIVISGFGFAESAGILGALRIDGGSLVRGTVTLSNDARIHVHSGNAAIFGPIHGAFRLEKSGAGSLQLDNVTNTGFTGKWVVMSNGQLRAATDGALGAVPASLVSDAITLTNRGRLMNWNNEVVIHPNRGIFLAGGTDAGGGLQAGWWAGLQVLSPISGPGGLYIAADSTPGWVVLAGANTFQGGLTNDARLRLGANEVIPDGASAGNVVLLPQVTYPVHSLATPRALDLAGFTETINGLSGGSVLTNSIGAAQLWLGANDASGSYTGRVAAGPSATLRIVKTGAGLQTMLGGFSGAVSLHSIGGVLAATGSVVAAGAAGGALSAGDVVAPGVLSTPGTMAFTNGAVVFNPGGSAPGVDADLFSANDLVFDTSALIVVTPLRAFTGAVPVFTYTNSLTGTASLLTVIPTNTRYTAFTVDDTTPGVITLSPAGGGPNELSWVGTNATWNVGAHYAFYNETTTSTDRFWQADIVRFGNVNTSLDRVRTGTVNIVGAVAPERIIVEGLSNITFAGSGRISGWAELFKGGTNLLVINTANDFSGPVTVTGGTLRVGNPSALGSIVGATWITNGGTIDVNGQNLGAELFYIAGGGVANTGAVVNSSGTDAINAMQRVYLVGNTIFGGNRRWDIRAVGLWPTNDAFIASMVGPVQLVFTGTAEKAWQNVTVGSGIDIVVGQGLFRTEFNTIWLGPATNSVRVMAGATLDIYNQTNPVNRILILDHNANLTAQVGGFTNLNVWAGPIQVMGRVNVEARAGQFLTLAGPMSGSGSLIILSNGTVFVTGDNSAWAGNLSVSTGTVDVGKGGATGDLGVGDVTNLGGRVVFSRTGDYTIPNRFISPPGVTFTNPSIVKSGGGTLTLTGSGSTFNGMVVLQEGGLALGSDTALGVTNLVYIATPRTWLSSVGGATRVLGHQQWWHTESGPNFVGSGEFVFTNTVFNGSFAKFLTVSNPAVTFTNTAPWVGAGPVTKYGPGELRIYGTVASAAFTNMAGRLKLGPGGAFTAPGAVLAFYPGSVFDVAELGGWTLSAGQTLAGGVGVVGDATLQGRVIPGWSPGTITFSNAATFNNATLDIELANVGTVGGGVNDLLEIIGAATFSGVSTVNVFALNNEFSAPRYAIVTNMGTRSGGAANLALAMGVMTNSRYSFALNDSDPNAIWLDVSGANKTLVWRGGPESAFWNVKGTTNNFLDGVTPETFWQADRVRFDQTAYSLLSTGRFDVTISEPVAPAVMTVDGGRAYTFTNTLAGARITGGATLIKLGSAPAFMGAANDYTGPTLISNGIFVLTHSSGVGVSNAGTYVASGATLDIYGNMVGHLGYEEVFASGEGVDGRGAIVNSGASQIQALRRVTLLGDTTFGGTGRWDIRNTNTVDGWLSTGGNPYNLRKVGTNAVILSVGTWVDPALGNIEIREGIFGVETLVTGLGDPTKALTVWSNAWFWVHNFSNPVAKSVVLRSAGGVFVNSGTIGAGQNYFVQPVVLTNGVALVSGPGNALFSEFRGAGGLRKEGAGEIWLTGTNTFAGPLQMNAGTLRLLSNSTALAISELRMEGGTLALDNSRGVNLANRLPDSAPIIGWGGTLQLVAATNEFSYERLGVVTLERGTLAIDQQIPAANGTTSIVHLAGLVHRQGLVNFTFSNVGASPTYYFLGDTATNAPGPHVLIDGLADGATIPFATVNGAGFARYSTERGVYVPLYLPEFDGSANQINQDLRLTANRIAETTNLTAHRSINTLVVSNQLVAAVNLAGNNLTIAGGGYRHLGTNNFAFVDSVGGGKIISGDAVFFVASATTRVAVAMDLASLSKEGGGTLILLNPATYTGKTSIGGVLQVGEMTAASIPTGQPVWNNGTLRFNTSVDHNFTGNIFGTGGLDKFGANTLTLSGPNNLFGSDINVYSGRLVFAAGSSVLMTNGTFGVGGTNVTGVGPAIWRIEPGATFEVGAVGTSFYGANFAANRPSLMLQDGGTVLIGSTNLNVVRFAHWPGTNVYNMAGGLLVVSNRLTMAWDGWSIVNQTGGTVRAGQIAFIRIDGPAPANLWRTSLWNLVGGTLEVGRGGLHVHTTRTDVAAATNLGLNVYGGALRAWGRDKETKIWNTVPVRLFGNLTVTGAPDERVEILALVSGAGGIRKVGEGALILARTNTYSGGTIVSNGTLTVKMRDALGTGSLRLVGGTLNLSLAGFYEEHLAGSFNQHTNPRAAVALGAYAGDLEQNMSNRAISEQSTYGYQGFIINPGPTNVVYTFAESFDDNVRLRIIVGGVTNDVLNNTVYNIPSLGSIDLPPGIHQFDLRLGNAASSGGGNANQWWTRWDLGFGWDPQGRGAPMMEYFQPLRAPEDGSLFIADTNGFALPNAVFVDGNSTISLIGSRDIPMALVGPVSIGSHTLVVTNNMPGFLGLGGTVTISGTPTVVVAPNVSVVVTQSVNGGFTDALTKDGLGRLVLRQPALYNGLTRVKAGTLELANLGALASGTIQIDSGAQIVATGTLSTVEFGTGQTLKGEGKFVGGLIMDSGSTLSPGLSPGILTMMGDLTLDTGSTLEVELNGLTVGTQYDQLLFAGGSWSLTLNNPTLNVLLGFTPVYGDSFTIVQGFSALSGTFNGLPDGAQFTVGTTLFEIDYDTSNITLTVVPEPATLGLVAMVAAAVLLRRRLPR